MTNLVRRRLREDELANIKSGVIEILAFHKGADNKISRVELLLSLQQRLGIKIHDRDMRRAIENLRGNHKTGSLICSSTNGGYWLAKNLDELEKYLNQDEARIREMAQRIRRQRTTAGLLINKQPDFFNNENRN